MNLNAVLQKAWQQLWHHRALWLFGAVLALVSANTLYPGPWPDPENSDEWIKIKVSDTSTVKVFGPDVTIDLTEPGGVRILTPDGTSWREFRELVAELNRDAAINLWSILAELAVILAGVVVFTVVARCVAETALIRMVDEAETTGRRLNVGAGLRKGLSLRAGRLFLIDLAVGLAVALAFIAAVGLAAAPVLLAIRSPEAILIAAGLSAFALLVIAGYVWLAASTVLSLLVQPVKRACVLEEHGLAASIRQGVLVTRHHLRDVGLVWLTWFGLRLLWLPVSALVLILLWPVLLATLLAGVVLGGAPAALVGAVAGLLMPGATPWIMGALAGLPVFVVVMISPMLFVGGLVEIYKSAIWTLAYRDLRALERPVQAPRPQAPIVSARGAAA